MNLDDNVKHNIIKYRDEFGNITAIAHADSKGEIFGFVYPKNDGDYFTSYSENYVNQNKDDIYIQLYMSMYINNKSKNNNKKNMCIKMNWIGDYDIEI
jgi:hypothetical protein